MKKLMLDLFIFFNAIEDDKNAIKKAQKNIDRIVRINILSIFSVAVLFTSGIALISLFFYAVSPIDSQGFILDLLGSTGVAFFAIAGIPAYFIFYKMKEKSKEILQ